MSTFFCAERCGPIRHICPVCGMDNGDRMERVFRDAMKIADQRDEARAKHEKLRAALERLASTESFTAAFDAKFAAPETIWAELRARGEFATAVLQGKSAS